MKKLKLGFTLSEILVTLGLMSFLLLILASTLRNVTPDQDKIMLKKAYKLTETIVSELVNDVELYPEPEDASGDWALANTAPVNNYYSSGTVSDSTKFCELFKSRLNVAKTHKTCEQSTSEAGMRTSADSLVALRSFTTSDGIDWFVTATDFGTNSAPCIIDVDVNGFNKGVNCFEGDTGCSSPDRFSLQVYSSGRVVLFGNIAKEYLRDTKIAN